MDLMGKGWLENVSVETDKSKEIIKFLDAVVIRLEGGGDAELELLNAPSAASKLDEEGIKTEKENETPKEGEDADHQNGNAKKRKSEDSGSESGAYTESENDGEDSVEKSEKRKRKTKSRSGTGDRANLHKTCSIFMRNLAPSSTKQDLENLCKEYEGFKRVAISDPAPERGFFRRGWITFEAHVDVKKICWNLTSTKVGSDF